MIEQSELCIHGLVQCKACRTDRLSRIEDRLGVLEYETNIDTSDRVYFDEDEG